MEQIQKFSFNKIDVEFQFNEDTSKVMINATQMAKLFGKRVENFTRTESTQNFIKKCLEDANKRFINIENEESLIDSKQKSGTFMHRILALKFAAWLNPTFELWIYSTIDKLLFEHYNKLKESLRVSAKRKNRIDEIKEALQKNELYTELEQLEIFERKSSYNRSKENRSQLDLFRESKDI